MISKLVQTNPWLLVDTATIAKSAVYRCIFLQEVQVLY